MGNLLKRQTQIPNIPETEVGYDMVFIPPNIEAQKRSRVQNIWRLVQQQKLNMGTRNNWDGSAPAMKNTHPIPYAYCG